MQNTNTKRKQPYTPATSVWHYFEFEISCRSIHISGVCLQRLYRSFRQEAGRECSSRITTRQGECTWCGSTTLLMMVSSLMIGRMVIIVVQEDICEIRWSNLCRISHITHMIIRAELMRWIESHSPDLANGFLVWRCGLGVRKCCVMGEVWHFVRGLCLR